MTVSSASKSGEADVGADEAAQPSERGRVARAWYRLSIRGQVLAAFVLIALVAEICAAIVVVLNARVATRVEIGAAKEMAVRFAEEAVSRVVAMTPQGDVLQELRVQLDGLRHVRISVEDAAGNPVAGSDPQHIAPYHGEAPPWFAALIGQAGEGREIPVIAGDETLGRVWVEGEPADEVAEVWEDVSALAVVTLLTNILMIAVLYLVLGRILDPLKGLGRGLRHLEAQNYKVALVEPRARELATIVARFNALAEVLDASHQRNAMLSQRLLGAQDEERRRTALELHDEVGPCIFGIRVNASSVEKLAEKLPEPGGPMVLERSQEILSILERLQSVNRDILQRLRPMALGELPLRDVIETLIKESAARQRDTAINVDIGRLAESYGDCIDLTLYRCIQESLTNVGRHAEASAVWIELGETEVPAGQDGTQRDGRIVLSVADNGRGFDPQAPRGRGLHGIEERVHMLGGLCRFESVPGGGSRIRLDIPLDPLVRRGERTTR